MSSVTNTEESLADGIFDNADYAVANPTAKDDFKPWHRPRKQYVRDRQWGLLLRRLLRDNPPEDGVVRYLGLPGTDLLDLRYFHDAVCQPKKLVLRFLGFNSEAAPLGKHSIDMNISLDEVRKMPFVDPNSDVVRDNYCRVVDEKSLALKSAQRNGPYDVINLDLCDGFASDQPGVVGENHYNALAKLLGLQVRSTRPWLLLLTTRIGADQVHADTVSKLQGILKKNIDECADFGQELTWLASNGGIENYLNSPDGSHLTALVGLCKWLCAIGQQSPVSASVESVSMMGYRVIPGSETTDIVSIALYITPGRIAVHDPNGIARLEPAPIRNECECAVRYLRRYRCFVDVDAVLHSDATIAARMRTDMKGLLVSARYDGDAYFESPMSNP